MSSRSFSATMISNSNCSCEDLVRCSVIVSTPQLYFIDCHVLNKMQEGKTALIKKDGGEMLIAIVLDKPLSEAQALVDDPDAFMLEIMKIIQNKHAHPVIAQMLHPDVRGDLPRSECAAASSEGQSSHTVATDRTQPQTQFQ